MLTSPTFKGKPVGSSTMIRENLVIMMIYHLPIDTINDIFRILYALNYKYVRRLNGRLAMEP